MESQGKKVSRNGATAGTVSTLAESINASGQVAGYYTDASYNTPFVESNGVLTILNVPKAVSTYANSINDSGQVAGYCFDANGNVDAYRCPWR